MSQRRDYYEILGVDKNATSEDIKRAYKKKAKQYHPDLHPNDQEAEGKFKEANEAYSVLSNQSSRQKYDMYGHEGINREDHMGGFSDFGFDDIFESFFGGSPFGTRKRGGAQRGQDLQYIMELSFEQAAFGIEREITIEKSVPCDTCEGTGTEPGTEPVRCKHCNGTGKVNMQQNTILGSFMSVKTCEVCQGTGKMIETPCKDCHMGLVKKKVKIKVNIPAGIDNGQTINMRGEGEPGTHGGPAGDLYIDIRVKPHKIFQRKGSDLYCKMPIRFAQAALGDQVEIPTLEKKISYKIPEGTQTETTVKFRNKGIQKLQSSQKGDLYVKFSVEVPKNLSSKQKELLQEFEGMCTKQKNHSKQAGFFDKVKDALNI